MSIDAAVQPAKFTVENFLSCKMVKAIIASASTTKERILFFFGRA
jgi:hypothetical protein